MHRLGQINSLQIERKGFAFAVGIGGGVVTANDSNKDVPFDKAQGDISFPNFKLGWMVNERTAIMINFPGIIY